MQSLCDDLRSQGRVFLEGLGQHPSKEWPGEPSLLVLGLTRDASCALGRRLEQNAIIFCGADAVAELVLLR